MLSDKKLFLFDIDGTVSVGNEWLDGSLDLFSHIAAIGGKSVFITNNSTKSLRDYIAKFASMGLAADESSFYTAATVTIRYLKKHYANQKLFVLGTRSFIGELREAGLCVTETLENEIACAVAAFDNELTYQKLERLCELLQTRDVDYLATNPDLACPAPFGMIPDCGAICRMVECATGRTPRFLGKPDPAMVEACLSITGFSREETLVVGDRLYTDIACGINAGVDTAVVFTGEAKPEDLRTTPFVPSYSFGSVRELLRACQKAK